MTQPIFALSPPLLLATDGSSSARIAQDLVRPIAELLHSQFAPAEAEAGSAGESTEVLTVITVHPRPQNQVKRSLKLVGRKANDPPAGGNPSTTEADQSRTTESAVAENGGSPSLSLAQLTDLVQADFPPNFPLSVQVRQGQPATEILNCARSIQASLIVVGHRGVGGMRELLLGSVSTAIARYAPCSVLIVRTQANQPIPASLRHVLLVVDATSHDQQAFAITRQLVAAGIETITLLHVQPPLNASYLVAPFTPRNPSWQLNQSLQDAQREQGEQILQKAVQALAIAQVTVQTHLHTGDAGPSICQIAAEVGATLIMMGSDSTRRSLLAPLQAMRQSRRNRAGVVEDTADPARPVLRNTRLSVTEDYVIHYAPCPVLLCRATVVTPQNER